MVARFRYYDWDDPPAVARRICYPGLGTGARHVGGEEAGQGLPADWMPGRPLCCEVDPEVFFPDRGDAVGSATAKRICGRCPIMAACREHNLDERFGIWGGLSEKQRRKLRKKRRKQRKTLPELTRDGRHTRWER
jgi:WhiB family transcriptional regulator, redox-sensing transcriptional regulator